MQSKHFKTDDKGDGFDKKISKDNKESKADRSKKKDRERKRESAAVDEDEDLRRAIEESKKTAMKDEERRKKDDKIEAKGGEAADKDGEFDFGAGFEKFATN